MISSRALRIGILTALVLAASPALPPLQGAGPNWKAYRDKPDSWYCGPEGAKLLANILSHQSDQGSWPKNIDTTAALYTGDRRLLHGTFDNGATFGELRFLARAYHATQDEHVRDPFRNGLDHVLRAQYSTGGWPQSDPPGKGYQRHITFNDGAMVNVLEFLRDVAHSGEFSFVDDARRSAANKAFAAGIACILKCQILVNGERTIWCGQHDETSLEPRWGRSFEPPALTSAESAGILRLLMSQDNPDAAVKQAVHAGVRWFERSRILGIRQAQRDGDKIIVRDNNAPPLWARFSEFATNRPIFCGRDGVIRYDIARSNPNAATVTPGTAPGATTSPPATPAGKCAGTPSTRRVLEAREQPRCRRGRKHAASTDAVTKCLKIFRLSSGSRPRIALSPSNEFGFVRALRTPRNLIEISLRQRLCVDAILGSFHHISRSPRVPATIGDRSLAPVLTMKRTTPGLTVLTVFSTGIRPGQACESP